MTTAKTFCPPPSTEEHRAPRSIRNPFLYGNRFVGLFTDAPRRTAFPPVLP